MAVDEGRGNYLRLLISLILLGGMYPLLKPGALGEIAHVQVGTVVWTMSFWLVLYAALHALHSSKRVLRTAQVLFVLVVLSSVLKIGAGADPDNEHWYFFAGAGLLSMALLALTTFEILKDVLGGYTVDLNRIWGAVCVYILVGLFFAQALWVLELVCPGSLWDMKGPLAQVPSRHIRILADVLYFSFVTLGTLGYGDIYPVGHFARFLASAEALVGQLYLTILVARLVGLHISGMRNADDR